MDCLPLLYAHLRSCRFALTIEQPPCLVVVRGEDFRLLFPITGCREPCISSTGPLGKYLSPFAAVRWLLFDPVSFRSSRRGRNPASHAPVSPDQPFQSPARTSSPIYLCVFGIATDLPWPSVRRSRLRLVRARAMPLGSSWSDAAKGTAACGTRTPYVWHPSSIHCMRPSSSPPRHDRRTQNVARTKAIKVRRGGREGV